MIEHAGSSALGPVRPNNEDCIAHRAPEESEVRLSKGCLFVVADGVGGSRAGEVASKEAADALIQHYYKNGKSPGRALQEAFQQANLHVYDMGQVNPDYRRMETTLSAFALVGDQAYIGHVGDSRIYLVRDRQIEQLTRDHSEVGELVRMQLLTADEARHHPRRNVITRSVGSELMLQVDYRHVDIRLNDIFVTCTDGMWEPVEDSEIAEIVSKHSPEDAVRLLTELGVERGTADNLSIQVVKVVEWERKPALAASKNGLLQKALRLFSRE